MPRRKADHLHHAAHSFRADRHAKRGPATEGEVGPPPAHLDEAARQVWAELSTVGTWLSQADRLALELACRAVAALRAEVIPSPALLGQVGRSLDRLGLSPGARGESTGIAPSRAAAPDDPLAEWRPDVSKLRGRRPDPAAS